MREISREEYEIYFNLLIMVICEFNMPRTWQEYRACERELNAPIVVW